MKVRCRIPAVSPIFRERPFPEIFVHTKFDPRELENEEKLLCPSEQNFTDQVVLDCLIIMHSKERKANSPLSYKKIMSASLTESDALQAEQ